MDTAQALRDARRRSGLTQQQLAEKTGTSQASVSAYESGSKRPSVDTLSRLLAASGSRLVVEAAAPAASPPSRRDQAKAGRILLQVLDLAAHLPVRHDAELRFPRLGTA
ncbi:MAG: hypothetical protein QOG62_69 [Thermoleophilaceae bacterium]|jgi:transcriptional regulator with XRE-family HTH domain|nr:hypothetical protein [Thermoleophilaceae bacterium]